MTVYVSGVGIVSSLGQNYAEHKANLFAMKEGITKNTYDNHGWTLEAYTGCVFDDQKVPDCYQNETRNFKFAFSALQEALDSSGIDLKNYHRVAMCLGTSLGGKVAGQEAFYRFLDGDHKVEADLLSKTSVHHIADELMAYHDIIGETYVISTACSASNNAVILGTQLLQDDECDLAICGGCDELSDISLAGFVILVKDKTRAKYGKIIGGVITSDAYHITAPKPTGEGAAHIAQILVEKASIDFKDVDYINGHGTGTQANDKMEKNMYHKFFPETTLVSSTKGQTGHTLGAAGIIELINCLAAIEEQTVPATQNSIGHEGFPDNFVYNQKREHVIKNVMNFSFAFGGNNSGVLLSSLDSDLETFSVTDDMTLAILSSASSLDQTAQDSKQYQLCGNTFNDFKAYRFKKAMPPKTINPAHFRKMDDFSKMVALTTDKALRTSGLNLKKMDTSKVGIVFVTPSGPVEVVEGIEEQITKEGYAHVSASRFPFTVMNAAAGMLSILFKIKGPVSVISSNSGAIDGIQYAKEMMQHDNLNQVILVSANQWTEFSMMWWQQMCYDSSDFVGADYCSVQILSRERAEQPAKILGSRQLKYQGKSLQEVAAIFDQAFQELLKKLSLSSQDIKACIWNSRKKIDSTDYDFLKSLADSYSYENLADKAFAFASNGAGEGLIL